MKAIDHFLEQFPPPPYVAACADGTDYEEEAAALYAICRYAVPTRALELGTRHGVSTRVIALALSFIAAPWEFITVDPDTTDPEVLKLPVRFVQATGQEFFTTTIEPFNLIHIDTDPHSYVQTMGWMDTFIKSRLTIGGVAVFHDFSGPVGEAVKDWCKGRNGWRLNEWPSKNGLGALWKVVGATNGIDTHADTDDGGPGS